MQYNPSAYSESIIILRDSLKSNKTIRMAYYSDFLTEACGLWVALLTFPALYPDIPNSFPSI